MFGGFHRDHRGNVRPERRGEQGGRHEQGIERANASKYGLGASVFTKSSSKGRAMPKLECGVVTVNSVLGFAGIAALPFGGVGDSGFGRIHGADGLREFSNVKSWPFRSSALRWTC